jgi:carotenoid cleavage dioxygenase-like enzyme
MPGFGTAGAPDVPVMSSDDGNAGNTSILPLDGEIWALWEAGSPVGFDPDTLATHGLKTLRDDLTAMPFLAHPKVEPSGRVWNLGLGGTNCVVWRLGSTGALEHAELIKLPRASYIHDWAMTARHLVILLQPWTYTALRTPIIDGLAWSADAAFQVLVLDKDDLSQRRLYELPAFFFLHTGDAYEEPGGAIRLDLCAYPDPTWTTDAARDLVAGRDTFRGPYPELVELTLTPDGRASMARTGIFGEFPQIDRRRQGQPRALTALVADPAPDRHGETALALWDWRTGAAERFDFGADHIVEEPLLTPYGPGERDTWIVATTLNLAARATELHVLDAAHLADGPLATWRSAHAAPLGFHGAFVPG